MGKTVEGKPWSSMSKVYGLAKTPGTYTDPGTPGFGLRVGKKKAVWFYRASIGSGEKRKAVNKNIGELVPVGHEADGVKWFDLQQARSIAVTRQSEEKLPEAAKQKLKLQQTNTLRTVLPEFLRHRLVRGRKTPLSEATKKDYQQIFDVYLSGPCANWNLVDTQGAVRLWLNVVRDVAKQSVSKAFAAMNLISGIYDYLEVLDEVDKNPMRKVRRLFEKKRPEKRESHVPAINLPTFAQQALTIRNPASRTAVLVDLISGMRKNAVLGLRWEWLNLDLGTIQVPEQTPGWKGWHGQFPLSVAACELLKDWREQTTDKSEWVFPARHGSSEHMIDIRGAINHACKGIEQPVIQADGTVKMRPYGQHDLRRTFGTVVNLLFPGDVQLAGALLAHRWAIPESPETDITFRYQSTRQQLQNALDQVAAFVYEVADIWPMSERTKAALDRAGIDPRNLQLITLADDDSDDQEEAGKDRDGNELTDLLSTALDEAE